MQKSSLKQNRVSFSALVIFVALAANGCAAGSDPDAISQVGDELKGGIPGSGKTKDHGHAQAGAGGSDNEGQGKAHSQAGHGSAAEQGQGKAHNQAGDAAGDDDSAMDESK